MATTAKNTKFDETSQTLKGSITGVNECLFISLMVLQLVQIVSKFSARNTNMFQRLSRITDKRTRATRETRGVVMREIVHAFIVLQITVNYTM